MLRILVRALILSAFLPLAVMAQDSEEDFTRQDAKDMAFSKLSDDKQKAVIAMLKKLMNDSIKEAESSIRENGALIPFGYVSNAQGQGQFLRIDESQSIKPEYAAHAVQKAIITNAYKGNLIASALYMTAAVPDSLGEDIQKELTASIGNGRSIDDVRFLMVELQHLGGLGLVMTVPYWQVDGEWRFGDPVQKRVAPELHKAVRNTFQRIEQSG